MKIVHDSHQSLYRSRFGALPTGAEVTLRLTVEGLKEGKVLLRLWSAEDGEKLLPMVKILHTDLYEANFAAPAAGGLLWYYFLVQENGRSLYYGNNAQESGGVGCQYEQEPPSYQITVYDRQAQTPSWFKQAVVYQIFPDRFYRSTKSKTDLTGKPGAVVHSCWEDRPYYCKDEQGAIVQYDFFGGNLAGIEEKLSYLQEMGFNALYLNPIFLSESNHRYDTADYKTVDSFLGTNKEFAHLCQSAAQKGIKIILDGVFSHTGANSVYFNKNGTYPSVGAYQSKDSPYYSWYKFKHYPDQYLSWWGVGTLPEVQEDNPAYMDFIFRSEDSVLHQWLHLGVSGWRLDVADELAMKFLTGFWQKLKKESKDNVLIGEVWEDASHKVSYGEQRAYFSGGKLDSVMNYVLRNIMLDFVLERADAAAANMRILQLAENYPPENFYALLNLLGSHDVERIYTILQGEEELEDERPELQYPLWMLREEHIVQQKDMDVRTVQLNQGASLSPDKKKQKQRRQLAQDRLCFLFTWLMTLPGAPCVYYGDEAGVEGQKDPDNRKTFPWGRENRILQSWCRQLIHLRRHNAALMTGRYIPLYAQGSVLAYARAIEGGRDEFGQAAADGLFIVVLNGSSSHKKNVSIDTDGLGVGTFRDLIHKSAPIEAPSGKLTVTIPPLGVMVLQRQEATAAKRAGVLLHPTSLPVDSTGDITAKAYEFIDFLYKSKQSLWQILPLNPPDAARSPYQSVSAFAGNAALFAPGKEPSAEVLADFCRRQQYWLEDYALFKALKDEFGQAPWYKWPEAIRKREPQTLAACRKKLQPQIGSYKLEQYFFFAGWQKIKKYAHSRSVAILGDMPIFVSHDSADCWSHQNYFLLDMEGRPLQVAGVPPDYFAKDGQLWGNPLYAWEELAQDQYLWWEQRLKTLSALVDEIRIDHFRGFSACWGVEYGAKTAAKGEWYSGPGAEFFDLMHKKLPGLRLVAENLGVITEEICRMKTAAGLPGMRILQFGIKERQGGSVAFDTEPDCYAYTGTHDNNTSLGWYQKELTTWQQEQVREMLHLTGEFTAPEFRQALLEYLYSRRAATVIVPMQDILALPGECRMNTPGTAHGNWSWKMTEAQLSQAPTQLLAALVEKYGRQG